MVTNLRFFKKYQILSVNWSYTNRSWFWKYFKIVLFKKDKLASCQEDLSSLCELAVVTLGSNGSLIVNKNNIEIIESITKGKIIDTTGAGDIYAGGFIHGLINNYSLKKCGELGSICAGHIITQLGSRSNTDL